jgi:hypothetical protein
MSTADNVDRGDNYTPPNDAETSRTADDAAAAAAAVKAAENAALGKTDETKTDAAKTDDKSDDKSDKGDDPARDTKGRFIPKQRFDEAVGKERDKAAAAQRQVAELQERLKQFDRGQNLEKIEQEISELETQHAKALLDGNAEKAAQLMRDIRLKERTIAISQSEAISTEARRAAAEEVRMDMAISELERTYPVLNAESDEYDQDVTDMVLATQRSLIENERMSPSQALAAAAQKVMSKLMPTAKQGAPEKKGLGAAAGATERDKEAVARNLEASKRQPPSSKEVGMDHDKAGVQGNVDVGKMSYEEFVALPEATKARLRGDMV